MSSTEPLEILLEGDDAGQRIDRVLAERLAGYSRTVLQRFIDDGRVDMDGVIVARKTKARAGSVVTVLPEPPQSTELVPEDIPLVVLFEDEHLIILDKPAGLVVHPAPGHPSGTLVNAVLFHTGARAVGEGTRPGIVHRLDKDTSGVMVVAKTPETHSGLVAQFQDHSIDREYLAIAEGGPPATVTYDTLHGRHPGDRKKFSTKVTRGRRAVTHVKVEARLHGSTLVRCRLETGRTHQIRVHLAEHGFPLLGDPLYGRMPKDALLRAAAEALGRQALHATVLGVRHPITGETLRFESPPPADFERARTSLLT